MPKKTETEEIKSYIRKNQNIFIPESDESESSTIDSYLTKPDISNVFSIKEHLKKCAINEKKITSATWEANNEHISAYIRALLTINYLKGNEKSVYKSLFECKNKDDVISAISDKLPDNYSGSHNVCKHIISEIKYLKKNLQYSFEEIIEGDTSETNEDIDNSTNPQKSSEQSNISDKDAAKKKISITVKDLNKVIKSDNELFNKLLNITDDEIIKTILEKFKDIYDISSELIEEWINTYKKQQAIVLEENKSIKELTILKESSAEEIKNLHLRINELLSEVEHFKSENSTLTSQLDDINKELKNYKYRTPNLSSNHVFSVELKELNRMLNSNLSESQITVKDELLNRVSRYIDEYSLIKIGDIVNKNRDLKSEIVQIILLSFLHEKSLL
ncbi:hypothetical protein [uncultured Clostridium sp.]|uniref:hypothetical protein n=1 Tax=uncultured Clostridium sp. TaxID=59620 RepID=UPI00258DD9FD|nr:hypothetical protein [uncultured Clostridium sp.]